MSDNGKTRVVGPPEAVRADLASARPVAAQLSTAEAEDVARHQEAAWGRQPGGPSIGNPEPLPAPGSNSIAHYDQRIADGFAPEHAAGNAYIDKDDEPAFAAWCAHVTEKGLGGKPVAGRLSLESLAKAIGLSRSTITARIRKQDDGVDKRVVTDWVMLDQLANAEALLKSATVSLEAAEASLASSDAVVKAQTELFKSIGKWVEVARAGDCADTYALGAIAGMVDRR